MVGPDASGLTAQIVGAETDDGRAGCVRPHRV